MKTLKTFIKNSVANYGQKIIRSGIGILTVGITARYLSPDKFGQYAYILAFMTISEVTAGMGVPMILCREVSKDKARASTLIASGLTLQFVLSMITLVMLSLIFYFVAPSRGVFHAALICAVAEILKFLGRFFWSVYQAFEKMGFGVLQAFISQGLYLVFLIVAIDKDLGLYGIFTALLLGHLAGAIFGYATVAKLFARPEFKNVKALSKFFFMESYPLAIRGIFRKLNYRAGTLFLAALRTNFDVAMFSGAHKIVLNVVFASAASSQAIFPIFSRFAVSSRASLDTAYQASLKFALLIGFPLAIFLTNFSEPLIVLILGDKYVESAGVLGILGWALVPLFVTSFVERVLVAGNRQGLTTVAMAAALGVSVLLNISLIPRMSYVGAGIAAVASEIVVLCLTLFFASRYMGLHVSTPVIVKPLLAGVATIGILAMLPDMNIIIGGMVEVLVYTTALLTIRTFSEEEICLAKELLRRAVSAKPLRNSN